MNMHIAGSVGEFGSMARQQRFSQMVLVSFSFFACVVPVLGRVGAAGDGANTTATLSSSSSSLSLSRPSPPPPSSPSPLPARSRVQQPLSTNAPIGSAESTYLRCE